MGRSVRPLFLSDVKRDRRKQAKKTNVLSDIDSDFVVLSCSYYFAFRFLSSFNDSLSTIASAPLAETKNAGYLARVGSE